MTSTVLVVDDDRSMCELIRDGLAAAAIPVTWTTSPGEAVALAGASDVGAVVTDLRMREMDGIELARRLLAARPGLPVIVITAFGSISTAVGAIRAGAYDFLVKPFELETLQLTVERALRHRNLTVEVETLRRKVEAREPKVRILGESPAIRDLLSLLERIKASDAGVLIRGETGTGKELVARRLHELGPRPTGPFVALNCAAVPEDLLESELFGHEKGAFTGASTARRGLLAEADGGTLFLDEIGDLPIAMQPKLLRSLQERSFRPVGGSREIPFDARVVAATHRDLEADVEAGRFREDLFFRIAVFPVDVPPLRSRGNDVLVLAQAMIAEAAARIGRAVERLAPDAAELLLAYSWPGNVRELQNCIERAVALCDGDSIRVEDLPGRVRDHRATPLVVASDDVGSLLSLEEVERLYILRVIEVVQGNKTLAAQILGLDRKTLRRKLERYLGTAGPDDLPA